MIQRLERPAVFRQRDAGRHCCRCVCSSLPLECLDEVWMKSIAAFCGDGVQ